MSPERFDCRMEDCLGMDRCDDGDFIKYDDYEKLQAEVARLRNAEKLLFTIFQCVAAKKNNGWSLDDTIDEQVRDGVLRCFAFQEDE